MGLIQIVLSVVVGVTLVREASSSCYGAKCGCIHIDHDKIDKKDLISEPLRTAEFQHFKYGLFSALRKNWQAFVFAKTFVSSPPMIPDEGRPLCRTERKHILGFWKDGGSTLCVIVAPDIFKAECCGETCCGPNTRCEPTLHLNRKFLIYCDGYYPDGDGPKRAGIEETDISDFNEATLAAIDPDDAGSGDAGSGDGPPPLRRKRSWSYGSGHGYFAFRHDRFPLICTCRTCDC